MPALRFVVLLGIVSLFADMTYEGARSAIGPYLGLLGASAFVVGLVSGGGELAGYALRLWSGRLADRTRRYWLLTVAGYAVNLLAVPLLAFAGNWPAAAALVLLERAGKALRTPARDAMLSYATRQIGRGWGFGLHEALDQVGATIGPLVVAAAVAASGDYRRGFLWLAVPALAALAALAAARHVYPHPERMEPVGTRLDTVQALPRAYWVYVGASALVAAGYADYALLAFHFDRMALVGAPWIPALYAAAMAADAIAALAFGRWFDRRGLVVLMGAMAASASFAPLAFGARGDLAVAGALVWGIGMGAQESIMRAAVAGLSPPDRRGTAYGLFHLAYGAAWFAGSALMGWLYGRSRAALVAFSVTAQLLAIPGFAWAARLQRRGADRGRGLA